MGKPSKKQIFDRIREQLGEQLAVAERAVEDARASFTVGDDRAENRGERGTIQEKSWLLSAHAGRVEDLRRKLYEIERADPEERDTVGPGALVFLRGDGSEEREIYFLNPALGGTEIELEGMVITVVSPVSPMGDALSERQAGDVVEIRLPGGQRRVVVDEVH